jgi:hypothetical protein
LSASRFHGSRVASALAPAAQNTWPAMEYRECSTTSAAGIVPRLSTTAPNRRPAARAPNPPAGSCAQIGRNVHLSGGVGIGGVLEPMQANPTIIEDNCFIGARSEVGEGVIVEANSVISMGVYIGQSTKIYDRATGEVTYGRIPEGSVVVSGNLPSADGKYSLYCAVIVKRVDEKTRAKTSINELLRD